MIAHDTNAPYYHGDVWNDQTYTGLKKHIYDAQKRAVFHAPAMYHHLQGILESGRAAAVFVHRPLEDVLKSWERIGAGAEEGRRESQWEEKHKWWRENKDKFPHAYDVYYNDLEAHPLWVPPKKRGKFLYWHTSPDDDPFVPHVTFNA
jgi:hypothetical protein